MQLLAKKQSPVRLSRVAEQKAEKSSQASIEMLAEGQECPFCHFAKLKREDGEIVCPICGYGRRACT